MSWFQFVSVYNMSSIDAGSEDRERLPVVLGQDMGQFILVPHNCGHDLFKELPTEAVGKEVYGLPAECFWEKDEEAGWPEASDTTAFKGKPFSIQNGFVLWATSISDIEVASSNLQRWLEQKELKSMGYAHPNGKAGIFPPPPPTHMYHEVRGHWEGTILGLAYPAPIYRCRVPGYGSWLNHWEEWIAGCSGYEQMSVVPGTLIWDKNKKEWLPVEGLKGWQDQNPFKVVDPYPGS